MSSRCLACLEWKGQAWYQALKLGPSRVPRILAQCSLSALSQAMNSVFIPIPSDGRNAFYQVSRMKADDGSTLQSQGINSCLIHREDLRKHSDWLSVSHVSKLGPMCQGVGGREAAVCCFSSFQALR